MAWKMFTLVMFLVPVISAQNDSVLCTEDFCKTQIEQNPCKELPKACNSSSSIINGIMMLDPSVCNCCDYCLTYLEEGDDCVIDGKGQPLLESVCGPGLWCKKAEGAESATCVPLESECTDAQQKYDKDREEGIVGFTEIRPGCDERGDYLPVHCIGGSICYCVNLKGERIFGEQVYTDSSIQDSMKCECSLAAWKVEQLASEMDVYSQPVHCLEDGSFDRLQCVEGVCKCLDLDTNMPDDDVGTIEMNLVDNNPECFDSKIHTKGKYMRACEEEAAKIMEERQNLLDEDIVPIGLRLPNCQYDGRYSRLMITDTQKFCVDPDGNKLGYEAQRSDEFADGMDCNCARTVWLLEREGAIELPTCCSIGNYKGLQCRRGMCYCVDCNGNQIQHEVEESMKDTLLCDDSCAKCVKTTDEVKKFKYYEPVDIEELLPNNSELL